jgi:TRAP-type uncharacterized transport system fused permease subunit
MLSPDGGPAPLVDIVTSFVIGALGVAAFAAGMAGYLFNATGAAMRALLFLASALLLAPGPAIDVAGFPVPMLDAAGLAVLIVACALNARAPRPA